MVSFIVAVLKEQWNDSSFVECCISCTSDVKGCKTSKTLPAFLVRLQNKVFPWMPLDVMNTDSN